jgi:hypothetical protein
MPGSPLAGTVSAGFGADRVAGMVVAVHLAVGGDRGCVLFPAVPRGRIGGHRPKRGDCPGGRGAGGVLAQAAGAVVHHGGDLGQVGLPLRVGQAGDAAGPRALGLRQQLFDARPDPGVQDGGDVAGSGQVPGGDGGADDLGRVQTGQLGGAQAPVQPPGLGGQVLLVASWQGGQHHVAVAVIVGGAGLVGPDRVQDAQVVGVGQVPLPDHRRGQLGAVPGQDVGEHGDRLAPAIQAVLATNASADTLQRVRPGLGDYCVYFDCCG